MPNRPAPPARPPCSAPFAPVGLELKIPPVFVSLIAAGLMWLAAHAVPGLGFALPLRRPLVLAPVLAGIATAVAGIVAIRRAKTTGNPRQPATASALVTAGIYRFTRNPMYLGLLLLLAGWAAWLANGAALLLLPAFVAYLTRFQIMVEERALTANFGPAYVAYLARVRRWL